MVMLQCHITDSSVDTDAAQRAMQEYEEVSMLRCNCSAGLG